MVKDDICKAPTLAGPGNKFEITELVICKLGRRVLVIKRIGRKLNLKKVLRP